MIDWAAWVGSLSAVIAASVAGVVSLQLRAREKRQAIADVNVDLTTGEVAAARDTVGTALYSDVSVDPQELISAYFKLHWAFQRAENTYRVFNLKPSTSKRDNGQYEDYLSWNFSEVVENLVLVHERFGQALGIEDVDAWEWFQEKLQGSHPELSHQLFEVR